MLPDFPRPKSVLCTCGSARTNLVQPTYVRRLGVPGINPKEIECEHARAI